MILSFLVLSLLPFKGLNIDPLIVHFLGLIICAKSRKEAGQSQAWGDVRCPPPPSTPKPLRPAPWAFRGPSQPLGEHWAPGTSSWLLHAAHCHQGCPYSALLSL